MPNSRRQAKAPTSRYTYLLAIGYDLFGDDSVRQSLDVLAAPTALMEKTYPNIIYYPAVPDLKEWFSLPGSSRHRGHDSHLPHEVIAFGTERLLGPAHSLWGGLAGRLCHFVAAGSNDPRKHGDWLRAELRLALSAGGRKPIKLLHAEFSLISPMAPDGTFHSEWLRAGYAQGDYAHVLHPSLTVCDDLAQEAALYFAPEMIALLEELVNRAVGDKEARA